jgi:hypothetical protein
VKYFAPELYVNGVSLFGTELSLPVNIAVFGLGAHYKYNYFGVLKRATESEFGPGENILCIL